MKRVETIQPNNSVILYDGFSFGVLIQSVQPDQITNTRYGNFHHNDIINKFYGSKVYDKKTNKWLVACKLTSDLLTLVMQRRTQIIYNTDIPLILALLDAKPQNVIFESGTGSGSLTIHLANAVSPGGHIYTFEFHEERYSKAQSVEDIEFLLNFYRADFKKFNLDSTVHSIHRDVYKDGFFPESSNILADSIFLDLPQPWLCLKYCLASLKPLGRVVTFSPCIEQIQNTASGLKSFKFSDIRVYEAVSKPWGIIKTDSYRRTQELTEVNFEKMTLRSNDNNSESTEEDYSCAWNKKVDSYRRLGKQFQYPTKGHTSYILTAIKPPTAVNENLTV